MDFWRICEEQSGMRLDWFFNDCLHSNRIAGYEVTSKENDGSGTTVVINSFGGFKFPVCVEAQFEDGSIVRRNINRLMDKQTLHFETNNLEIKLNPDEYLVI
jgi:hypothetical protein